MDVFSKPLDAFLRCALLPDADGDFKDVKVRKKKKHGKGTHLKNASIGFETSADAQQRLRHTLCFERFTSLNLEFLLGLTEHTLC